MAHMTYRQLLDWMTRDATTRDDATLDEPIVVRIYDNDRELVCGGIRSASVDPGCTEQDVLIFDGDQEPDDGTVGPEDDESDD